MCPDTVRSAWGGTCSLAITGSLEDGRRAELWLGRSQGPPPRLGTEPGLQPRTVLRVLGAQHGLGAHCPSPASTPGLS